MAPSKRTADPESPAVSEPTSKRQTPEPKTANGTSTNGSSSTATNGTTTTATTKLPAAVLQRRREGRQRQKESIQNVLDEAGIRKTDIENNFKFSSIPIIQLINQKNYYTDYLKKDDQFQMVRKVKDMINGQKQAKKQADLDKKQQSQDILTKLKNSNSLGSGSGSGLSTLNNSAYNSVNNSEFEDDDEDEGDDHQMKTIILHPGSTNIKIGLSTDIDPKSVLNVIAHKRLVAAEEGNELKMDPRRHVIDSSTGEMKLDDEDYLSSKKPITSSFRERMRYYKRRILPNSNDTCYNFNLKTRAETIRDHDDVHKIESIDSDSIKRKSYVIGDDVLKLSDAQKNWLIRSPFLSGRFNDKDLSYTSKHEILGDIELILSETLKNEFDIHTKKQLKNYNCILIVSNLYDKQYIEEMIEFLLKIMNFNQVTILQEGLSATFGSGVSTGCIADIGSTGIKICCVEEGQVLSNSQIELNYGSNDITRFLVKNLISHQFPYRDINCNDLNDWKLGDWLKENYCTFNDANVAVQLFKFFVRKPGQVSYKYEFKSFDDVMVSPMALFYPHVFIDGSGEDESGPIVLGKLAPAKKLRGDGLFQCSGNYEGYNNDNPESLVQQFQENGELMTESASIGKIMDYLIGNKQPGNGDKQKAVKYNSVSEHRKNMTPLDKAIIESISLSGCSDQARLEKLYNNILLIGGGSKVEGLEEILQDRLHIMRPGLLGSNKLEELVKLVQDWKLDFEKKQREQNKEAKDGPVGEVGENEVRIGKDDTFELTEEQLGELEMIVNASTSVSMQILSNSKDIDPSTLAWKGGSVYARLRIAEELWVNEEDWDKLGSRSLNYISLFNY